MHLAAQHDHPAAVSLILSKGGCRVDTGLRDNDMSVFGGATPLHRASFSGAISAMQILLDWGCNNSSALQADILAKDESFGDLKTPLHKAVAGGRPVAVQLLLMHLNKRGLLLSGLAAVDSQGLTPLESAKQFTTLNNEELENEKCSVRRWDNIAGGPADWKRCQTLLEDVAAPCKEQDPTKHKIELPAASNPFENQPSLLCIDGDVCSDGNCKTASWENAFRSALASSLQTSIDPNEASTSEVSNNSLEHLHIPQKVQEPKQEIFASNLQPLEETQMLPPENETKQFGRPCDLCRERISALFRLNGKLVCRTCKRSMRTRGRVDVSSTETA